MRKYRIWNNYDQMHGSFQDRIQRIDGIASFVQEKIDDGYEPYFLTFMFNQLNGNKQSILAQMHREIERFNKILITKVHRDPNSIKAIDNLPVLIGFSDLPTIFKTTKKPLVDVITNDGLHFHVILLIPKESRLKGSLVKHIKQNEHIYIGPTWGPLKRIHTLKVKRWSFRVVRYVFKAFKWGRVSWDDGFMLFPSSSSERLGGSKFNPDRLSTSIQSSTKRPVRDTRRKRSGKVDTKRDRPKNNSDTELQSSKISLKQERPTKAELRAIGDAAYADWLKDHGPKECRC